MSTDSSKTKRCPECKRSVDASTMRPLSRTSYGSGVRYACPDCFARVMALRKIAWKARKKARATLNALRRERNEAAEWYGGLKHSSAESWEQVKAGFVKSYEALKESFARARKQL